MLRRKSCEAKIKFGRKMEMGNYCPKGLESDLKNNSLGRLEISPNETRRVSKSRIPVLIIKGRKYKNKQIVADPKEIVDKNKESEQKSSDESVKVDIDKSENPSNDDNSHLCNNNYCLPEAVDADVEDSSSHVADGEPCASPSIDVAGTTPRQEPAGVSCEPATDGRLVPQDNPPAAAAADNSAPTDNGLSWGFKDGRLVFIEPPVTSSKIVEDNHQYNLTTYSDCGVNSKLVDYSDFQNGTKEDLIPGDCDDFCEFNVNDFEVYDEFSDSESSCECEDDNDDQHFIVIRRLRGDGKSSTMVNNDSDHQRSGKLHNPDRDNLKSLLKKPNRNKKTANRRVIFNENKNEFFDADYIILIREDCELDEDDDEGVCTCQQHEMVRLACCEPNCNCRYDEPTPQSPKFAPPMEFVDAVTLSPPEGYKDMELMARSGGGGARVAPPVCKECSVTHDETMEDDGEVSQSDSEMERQQEKEKTDQSQQTTPTTPPCSENQNYNIHQPVTSSRAPQLPTEDDLKQTSNLPQNQGSPISGILKGGRLWKQETKNFDSNIVSSDSMTSDDESNNKRSVRFIESERAICDGAPESSPDEELPKESPKRETYIGATSPDVTPPEMTLTFKLGNHVLISNNSLKPNSAVRQLFPCTKNLGEEEKNNQQYLVTSESLRAFEEAKRAKLPQIIQSGETDDTIKRAIERNTLRRSLIRYEPRSKKQPYKSDNSLVERIKQLTCDVDTGAANRTDQNQGSLESGEVGDDVLDISRSSPPGEEARNSPDVNSLSANKPPDKSFSPSSSSTTSSSSMSANQNYQQARKLSGANDHQTLMVDLKRAETVPDIQNNYRREMKPLPDIGGPHNHDPSEPLRSNPELGHCPITNKMSTASNTSESRRQFLAPLTACVTMSVAHTDDYYYQLSNNQYYPGDRISVASSGTEYSLEDIDDGLRHEDEERKRIAPDVLVGTPSASESGDELAMFVQQDAGRMERIKKKYQPVDNNKKCDDEDDEHDDYGFNRRPNVRGIKPRFSTTTEILQQIQNQLQPPAPPSTRVAWPPYYSENNPTDNKQQPKTSTGNYAYVTVTDNDVKTRIYPPQQYRPTSLQQEESMYQNCANQRCVSREVYQRPNSEVYSSVIRMGNDCYQSLPVNRQRHDRPHSPPPMDMSKQYHQTMVYIPYNHIDGYQPVQYYHSDYVARVSNQNQINKRYVEPVYQSRVAAQAHHHHLEEHHYNPKVNRIPYNNGQIPVVQHVMAGGRSESPLPGQFSTARSTQTPAATVGTCGAYYPAPPRYRPVYQQPGDQSNYAKLTNRHSFPRYPPADSISLTDSDSQHSASGSLQNGYRQSDLTLYASKDSPTKPRFIERGVPEGAASVSPQDVSGVVTSPQNPEVPTNQKAMFYAMNV
ncbi:unnamed protein product [Ceutorhynchus assimilis]|uniref:Uncharacterized protein n=1 Tax=Ceutorhynchus assimilis TaxID=467358 RepID=A0A9P0DEV2_9CUCU|nr:unnamed protein product [Ceutorhynchus assimilis]